MIRVGIADDHHLMRKGIIQLMKDFDIIDVVLEAENGQELLDLCKTTPVDVILMDLNMPVMDGYEATTKLKEDFPNVKAIGLSQHSSLVYVAHFMQVGGKGFLLKNTEEEELVQAICEVHEKGFHNNELVTNAMINGMEKGFNMKPHFPDHPFSENELEVLHLICSGKSSEEIALELNKSKRTIENQRRTMMQKVEAKNAVDLAMISLQLGLIELSNLNPIR